MRAGADNRELHRRQTNNNMRRQKDKISHRTGQKKYGRKPQADTGQDTLEGFGRRELRIQEFMPGPGSILIRYGNRRTAISPLCDKVCRGS